MPDIVTITERTKEGVRTQTMDITALPAGPVKCHFSMTAFHDGPPGRHWSVSGDRNPRNPVEGPVHQLMSFDID
jgi:hypothetical protein